MGLAPGWGGHSQKRRAGKGAGAEGQVLLAAHWLRNLAQTRDGRLRAKWPRGSCLWRGRGPEAQGEAQSEELLLPGSTRPATLQSSCRWPRWETPAQGCGVGLPRGPRRGVHGRDHGHMSGRFLCTGPTVWRGLWLPGTAHDLRAMPAPDSVGASRRRPLKRPVPSLLSGACVGDPSPGRHVRLGCRQLRGAAEPASHRGQCSTSHRVGGTSGTSSSASSTLQNQRHRNSRAPSAQKPPPFPWKGRTKGKACVYVCVWCVCMCMCESICARMCVHACACTRVCVYVCARVHVSCMHVCMCVHVPACACLCVYTYACMCAHVSTCTCVRAHALCVHTYVHVCARVCMCLACMCTCACVHVHALCACACVCVCARPSSTPLPPRDCTLLRQDSTGEVGA